MRNQPLDRRTFLQGALALGGAVALGGMRAATAKSSLGGSPGLGVPADSILDGAAADAPVDTIVVLMMENRSVDHHLGWLAKDEIYLEEGRRRYGRKFHFDADNRQTYLDPEGHEVDTWYLPGDPNEPNPYRRCDHPDPGHGWTSGRAQRDHGFLAEGSGNDPFALGYYAANDVPVYADLARRFTVFDRYHCSVLASTYPNRAYLHSAQSGGLKSNDLPTPDGYTWPAIWDKLAASGVPAGYFFVDLPVTALWRDRMVRHTHHLTEYFTRCASGTLPNVTYIDPGFTTDLRTDDHPGGGDTRAGQKFVQDAFRAFAQSPHWERGVFIVTYDEWGGFFDHVRPPLLPDDRASADDLENFGQAGFRVPTIMASPYAQRGYVDHNLYDHTSVLRFIEWRFLGAPSTGPGPDGASWYLTKRDRYANNIGASLVTTADPEVAVEPLPQVPIASTGCPSDGSQTLAASVAPTMHPYEAHYQQGAFERLGWKLDFQPLPTP